MDVFNALLKVFNVSAPFLYAGGAYTLFHWLDGNASDEAKKALSGFLKLKDYDGKQIALALLEVFDRLYTKPLFRWRAFSRSMLFSVVVMAIYVVELFGVKGLGSMFKTALSTPVGGLLVLYELIGLSVLLNIMTDYISLFIIRWWLSAFGSRPVLALIGGMAVGFVVIMSSFMVRIVVFGGGGDISVKDIDFVQMMVAWMYPEMFVIPAIFVFVWLPLFGLGILLLRAFKPISWAVEKAQWFLKQGRDHPLDAVGYVAGAIVFAVAATWQFFFKASS